MSGLALDLGLVVVLVAVNAFFSGSEMALLSLREGQVARMSERGRAGAALARLTSDPNRFLATIQVGITLAGFLASAAAAVSLAEPLEGPLGFLGGAARPAAIIVVTLVLTFLTLVIGELAPKRVALQRSERWALVASRPLIIMFRIFRPVVWLLGRTSDVLVRLAGVDPTRDRQEVTEEELRDIVASAQTITEDQRQILAGAFEVADRTLRQVLRPRRDVIALQQEMTAPEALVLLVDSGHSRAPVIEGDLDHTLGIVHLRDLFNEDRPVGELAHHALALPETLGVLDALRRMRAERAQLSIVIDEYGGVEGIVSLEDLLEEIVGEIYDETDRDLLTIVRHEDGSIDLPGGFPVHDLVDVGVKLPESSSATLGGLVISRLGRLPEPGDTVTLDGWDGTVLEVNGRAVARVRLSPREPAPAAEGHEP
jgi:putative hemolysin